MAPHVSIDEQNDGRHFINLKKQNGDKQASPNGQNSTSDQTWWMGEAKNLALMMMYANYPESASKQHWKFFRNVIAPRMGPPPARDTTIRSYLTLDGTPIEYSFSLSPKGDNALDAHANVFDSATIRYSLDLDATSPGYSLDTANSDAVIAHLHSLSLPKLDLTLWHILRQFFQLAPMSDTEADKLIGGVRHKSQRMLGFDVERNAQTTFKAYFLPCMLAAQRGQTRWEVVQQAVDQISTQLRLEDSVGRQLAMIKNYFARFGTYFDETARFLAVDLVNPSKARIKMYVQCPFSDIDGIWDFLTLGGQISNSEEHKAALYELYHTLSGITPVVTQTGTTEHAMQSTVDKTNGMIAYFVVSPELKEPTSKLFICVQKPFVSDDAEVVRRLTGWMQRKGWLSANAAEDYVDFLRALFNHRKLEDDGRGLHSFVAVSMKKGQITVETYLTPELFRDQN